MKKLIELDAALDAIGEVPTYNDGMVFEALSHAQRDVALLPTVDAVPVVHSEWIPKEKADTPYGLEMECAKCGFSVIVNDALYFKFCPNCGAKMDGKDGNDG